MWRKARRSGLLAPALVVATLTLVPPRRPTIWDDWTLGGEDEGDPPDCKTSHPEHGSCYAPEWRERRGPPIWIGPDGITDDKQSLQPCGLAFLDCSRASRR